MDLPSHEYNLVNFLYHILYEPLYLAGPIITFNDFIWQLHHPPRTITARSTTVYAVRWVVVYLLMEAMLHGFHVVAIKDAHAWGGFTPFQMSMVGYFNLKIIWLKLLIIWRFFRLWAMSDRIETTENMTRCMSDNYSAIDFWKSWHRSFNRWLVRYVYIPLGGSKYYTLNIFPTFTFVAIWHDISLKLLTWGWLVAVFILPEFLLRRQFGKEKWKTRLGPWMRHVAAAGAVVNILLMMTANLVGFAVGVDGVKEMAGGIFRLSGAWFLFVVCVALFSGVQIMFEWREMEKRRSVKVEK
ncbi:glycerol transporter [Rhizophlyctis rosea]|nr:glycerol transporter [Rhizophlyctis rosea]